MKITMIESRFDRVVGRVRDMLAGVGVIALVALALALAERLK